MLKELTHRHLAIMRRLVTGQPPVEICIDVNISNGYLSLLKKDPLFASKLEEMSQATEILFLNRLGDAKSILERLKVPAARKMQEMIMEGKVGDRFIKPDKQADMVAKMLDVGGPKFGAGGDLHLHITDAVVEAYMRKYHSENGEPEQPEQITDEEVIDV